MSTVRTGIVGAGEIGRLTARDLSAHPEAQIVAVADKSEVRAAELATRYGAQAFASLQAMLEGCDLDAVYIGIPNRDHAQAAITALDAGKHVMLDKPFALNALESQKIISAAHDAGRILFVGMNQRFDRNVQRARMLVGDGSLGDVYHARAFWRRRSGIPRIGSWFTSKAMSGGGTLLDIGVHVLDATCHILDDFSVSSISGATFTRFGQRGLGDGSWGRSERTFDQFDVDDFAVALIRFASGRTLSLETSWAQHQRDANAHGIELAGEEAGYSVFDDQLFRDAPGGGYMSLHGTPTAALPYPHCNRSQHFVNVVLNREELLVRPEEALKIQKVIDAIYLSAELGKEVSL
ncbi:MAG: Gfo/Idh/MocA family oxidoreductase [Proteobacteria bacterium]|nr:Gfo/Idh/MocA family oxidoreductase [Pseudomonadota bacterium]